MSREEAIDLLDNLIGMIDDNQENDYDTALKMAKKALEFIDKIEPMFGDMLDIPKELKQEPSGDLISRQAVLDLPKLKTHNTWGEVIYESVDVEDIKQLPPVKPQEPVYCDCNRMTKNEAIKVLSGIDHAWRNFSPEEYVALDMAIKALQAQADGEYITQSAGDEIRQKNYDLISRQAVLDMWRQMICYDRTCHYRDEGRCTETFCDFKLFEYKINHMSSVNPQEPKTGHWIAQDIYNCHTDFKCSECGYIHSFMHLYGKPTADYTYCPNCGAKMVEPQKRER